MQELSTAKKIFYAIVLASVLSLLFDPPAPLKIVSGFLQAFYLPGITLLLLLGNGRRPRLDDLFLPLLLSPTVLVLLVLGVHAFSGSFHDSLRISLAVLYVIFAAALFVRKGQNEDRPPIVPMSILLVSISFCSIIIVTYIVNDFLFYHDTCRHSSIANEIIYRDIPPMEPYFADIPIRSMWFQHLFQAAWKELSGLSIFHSMWLVNLVSAFTFPYLIARLASFFTSRAKYMLIAPVLAITGLDSAGWILLPVKLLAAFTGDVRGVEEVARLFSDKMLNSRYVLDLLAPPGTYVMSILDKYLTIDVHHYALNLILLCFILMLSIDPGGKSGPKTAVNIAVVMAGAWLFRIVNGIALVLTVVLAALFIYISSVLRKDRKPCIYDTAVFPALAVIVGAAGLFYYRTMTGAFTDGLFVPNRLALNTTGLITIAVPLAVLFPFTFPALKEIFTARRRECTYMAAWVLSLFVLSVVTDLRGTLDNYFIYPLFMLLVVPVAIRITGRLETAVGVRRIYLTAWILILFAVPPILTVRGYMLEKPHSKHVMRRYRITADERKLYDWIRENTGIDAVIVEKNEYNVMPYYSYRRNFYMTSWEILNFGYAGEKVERYRAIRDEIYSEGALSGETIRALKDLENEIYVVVWSEDLAESPYLGVRFLSHPEWFEKVYENPAGTVYALKE